MLSTRPLVRVGAALLLPMAQALPLANEIALMTRKDDDDDDKDDDDKDDDVVKWFGLKIKKPIFIGVVVAFIIFCLIMAVGTTVWRYKKKKARKAKEANQHKDFEAHAPPAMIQQDRPSSPQYVSPPSPGGPNDPYANKNRWNGGNQWSTDESSPYGKEHNNHQSWAAPSGPPPPTAHHPNRF